MSKAYSVFIAELNGGSTNAAITAALEEVLQSVQSLGRSASLHTVLKVTPMKANAGGGADKVTVSLEFSTKLPKPEQPQDFFWLTESGETSRQHPRQHDLELRQPSADEAAPLQFRTAS